MTHPRSHSSGVVETEACWGCLERRGGAAGGDNRTPAGWSSYFFPPFSLTSLPQMLVSWLSLSLSLYVEEEKDRVGEEESGAGEGLRWVREL